MSTRTTIQIDERLLDRVRKVVPRRGLSRFISETLEEKVSQIERRKIEEAMKEGYLATRRDREELNADWQGVDGEKWPD